MLANLTVPLRSLDDSNRSDFNSREDTILLSTRSGERNPSAQMMKTLVRVEFDADESSRSALWKDAP
jgi:hypothetical protein